MLVDTNNLVTAEHFRKNLEKYISAAQKGSGPVAVTQDSEVVGFFIGRAEYEALYGAAVKDMLTAREQGPTVSHDEVRSHIQKTIKRVLPKSNRKE